MRSQINKRICICIVFWLDWINNPNRALEYDPNDLSSVWELTD